MSQICGNTKDAKWENMGYSNGTNLALFIGNIGTERSKKKLRKLCVVWTI